MTAVEITVKLRLAPTEPVIGTRPTVYADLIGRPVVAVVNLDVVDPAEVGEAILNLLRGADQSSWEPSDTSQSASD